MNIFRCISRKWNRKYGDASQNQLKCMENEPNESFFFVYDVYGSFPVHSACFRCIWWRVPLIWPWKIIKFIHNWGKSTPKKALRFWRILRYDGIAMSMTPLVDVSDVCYIGQRYRMTNLDIDHANWLILDRGAVTTRLCTDEGRIPCERGDIQFCPGPGMRGRFNILIAGIYKKVDNYLYQSTYKYKGKHFEVRQLAKGLFF